VKTIRSNRVGKLVILHLAGPGEVLDGGGSRWEVSICLRRKLWTAARC
jgi:hypothetical protein